MSLHDNMIVRNKILYLLEKLEEVPASKDRNTETGGAAAIDSSDAVGILASLNKFSGWLTSTIAEEDSLEHLVTVKGGLLRGALELILSPEESELELILSPEESETTQEAQLLWALERVPEALLHSDGVLNDRAVIACSATTVEPGECKETCLDDEEAPAKPNLSASDVITSLSAFLRLVADAIVKEQPRSYFYSLAAMFLQFEARRSVLWLVTDDKKSVITAQKSFFILGHMLATVASPLPVLQDLILIRPDVASCVDCYGYLPLHHFADETWDVETLKYVLELNPAAVAVCDGQSQNTPIHILSRRGQLTCSESIDRLVVLLKLLLDCGEYSKSALTTSISLDGGLPLHYCCNSTVCGEIFRLIFDSAPEVANIVVTTTFNTSLLPIHNACKARYRNAEDSEGVIETLLDATNDDSTKWECPGQSLFHSATANCGVGLKTLQRIYDRQPENILKKTFVRGTPLHSAVQSGDADRVRWLLSLHPDYIKALDAYGRTPLYVIAAEAVTGRSFFLSFFLEPQNKDLNGGHYKVLTLLLEQYPEAIAIKDVRNTNLAVHETILSYLRMEAGNEFTRTAHARRARRGSMKLYFSMIRLLLRKHPAAALETMTKRNDLVDALFSGFDKTCYRSTIQFENLLPYDACVRFGLDPETHPLIREIMMAVPDSYAEQLRVFHYRERRGAMVLLFSKEAGLVLSASVPHSGESGGELELSPSSGTSVPQTPPPDLQAKHRIIEATRVKHPWPENILAEHLVLIESPPQIKYKCDGPLIWHRLRSHGDQALIRYIVTML